MSFSVEENTSLLHEHMSKKLGFSIIHLERCSRCFPAKNRDFPQNKSPEFVAGFLLTHMVRGCYIYLYSSLKTINQMKAAKVQLLEVDKENIMRHVFYDDKLCARSPRPFPPLLFFSVSSQ